MKKRSIISKNETKTQPIISEKPLEQVVDTLNEVILYPSLTADVSDKDTWVDMMNKYTSGMALGSTDSWVYEQLAHKNESSMLSGYFGEYNRSVISANDAVKSMYTTVEVERFLMDKFYTLVGQLENEFEWMKPRLKEKIKDLAKNFSFKVVRKLTCIDEDSIYYAAQLNAIQNGKEAGDLEINDIEVMVAPIANSVVTDIMAGFTMGLYDTFYCELVTEVTTSDFDIICDYMKPYLIDFRNDMLCLIVYILYNNVMHRSRITYKIYHQAKSLADELDIPFYY